MTTHETNRTARPTKEEAIARAGSALADMRLTVAQLTPREQAEAAYTPGGPDVKELEDRIRVRRGLSPIHGERP